MSVPLLSTIEYHIPGRFKYRLRDQTGFVMGVARHDKPI